MTITKSDVRILTVVIFILHIPTIFFYPTNFEGAYGEYANFFNTSNKINYVLNYYTAQFNTYFFSFIGSVIHFFIPILDGHQIIRILSAFSYFFLIPAIINISNFFKIKNLNLNFLLLLLFNPIIFYYGYRMYSDFFSFSISLFFFSKLITKVNKSSFFDFFFYGISILFKIYNLIFFQILVFVFYKKLIKQKKINFFLLSSIYFFLVVSPTLIYMLLLKKYLGFYLLPPIGTEDLTFSFFKKDGLSFVFNNFIFYIGYLNIVCFPIIFFSLINNKYPIFKYSLIFLFFILLSILSSPYLFIPSELDFGSLQQFIPQYYYKNLIVFFFLCFFIQIYLLYKKYKKNKYFLIMIFFTTLFIVIYFFILSNFKASQRYIVPAVFFFYLINWEYIINKKIALYFCQLIFIILNLCLLLSYYITGSSSHQVMNYLKKEQLVSITNVNVILPHVYHLYNNIIQNVENVPSALTSGIENKYLFVGPEKYIVNYNDNTDSKYNSSISIFGILFDKFSVQQINK